MARPTLVAVLIFALFVTGCAHQQAGETAAPTPDIAATAGAPPPADDDQEQLRSTLRRYSRQEKWLENFPILNAAVGATGLGFAGVGAVLAVVAVFALRGMANSGGAGLSRL
jgi:hypothetical protein